MRSKGRKKRRRMRKGRKRRKGKRRRKRKGRKRRKMRGFLFLGNGDARQTRRVGA